MRAMHCTPSTAIADDRPLSSVAKPCHEPQCEVLLATHVYKHMYKHVYTCMPNVRPPRVRVQGLQSAE